MAPPAVLLAQERDCLPPEVAEALRVCPSETVCAASADQLVRIIDSFSSECVIVVYSATVDDGTLRIVEQVRRIDRHCPLLILTSSVSTEWAVRAMRAGASDLLESNASSQEVYGVLKSLLERCRTAPTWDNQNSHLIDGSRMVGQSATIAEVRNQIALIAASDANVLITGESGTGKELAAELIHRNSPASARPFVAINCAAIPEALFESELFGFERGAFTGASMARKGKLQQASGGTLFLDEVGDMSLAAQAKILRAVENRVVQRLGSNVDIPVQIRLLAASNQDLELLTREKKFRPDLYFRLNVVRLNMPPLRERIEDIAPLAEHILAELSQKQNKPTRRIEGDLLRSLEMYDWPGNIRQLRNVLESILVFSSSRSIGLSDAPAHIRHTLSSSSRCYGAERSKILTALSSADWNRGKAARILGCSRMTLYRKMVKLSLQPGKH